MNITIIGHVCIDNNISENATYTTAGSPAVFMNKIYKKLPDVFVNIIARYGVDFLTYSKELNIYPKKPAGDWTLIYENKTRGKLRNQKAFNREYAKPLPINKQLRKLISRSDIVFFAPLIPNYSGKYIKSLIRSAQSNCLKIFLPQGYYRSFDKENNVVPRNFREAKSLVALFDFVVLSEQDHKNIKSIISNWAEKTKVIVTLGEKGSSYFYKKEKILVPVKPVKPGDIVDSVGSGDIFSASFAYKYLLTKDIKGSLSFANNIARQSLFYPAGNLHFSLTAANT